MRKALLVGVDAYAPTPLSGCVDDAQRIRALLRQHANGAPNFECRSLLSPPTRITRALLRTALEDLWANDRDVTLFYFAGHGRLTNLGGYLVTSDGGRGDDGIPMTEVLALANESKCPEAVIILDCCHSGAIGHATAATPWGAVLRDGVSVLGAAHESESAGVEAGGRGLFTSLACEALRGGAADVRGRVTGASIYAYADQILGAWDQRPFFRTHLSTLTSLRDCAPAVPLEILRLLPTYFPAADEEFPLDPSYDPELEPHDANHERAFSHFRKYLGAGLLEPVGADYLFHAALNSTSCRLTPLGRLYWQLAKADRL